MSSPQPTCKMLTGYSTDNPTPDVECGQLATHVATFDAEHFACADCYGAMAAHDEQLAGEYEQLLLGMTTERCPERDSGGAQCELTIGHEGKHACPMSLRAAQKQASRDEDARRLAAGEVTREQLWAENSFLPAEATTIDWSRVPALGQVEREDTDITVGWECGRCHEHNGAQAVACVACGELSAAERERFVTELQALGQPIEIPAGTVLHVEQPAPEMLEKLQLGLMRSGMGFRDCSFCGRPYGSRSDSTLCPPCRGDVPYDGWHQSHPEQSPFVQRSRLLSILMHRASEWMEIEELADAAAMEGETDHLELAEAALEGDEHAWKQSLWTLYVRQHRMRLSEGYHIEAIKAEVHVRVTVDEERG